MSRAPTSASGSALPRGQFIESPVASAHGASSSRHDSAPASPLELESARSRALNPMAKVFIPDETPPARKPLKENESSGDGGGVKTNTHPEHAPRPMASSQPGKGSLQVNHSSARRGHSWNANHLLNFQYDPIARSNPRAAPPARRYHHNHKQQAYDKELFLQANFRFLVSDFGDYLENITDPDKMLEWKDIAAVELSSSAEIQCPICLDSPPLCPQITSCGHIFCFPCILRYFIDGEDENRGDYWKKCPLCFTRTSSKELRTVHIHEVNPVKVGESLSFTLLTRVKGSAIPQKSGETWGSPAHSKDGRCHLYSKFTLVSDIAKATGDSIAELTSWAEKAQFGDDEELGGQLPYVFAAIDELKMRKVAWDEHRALEFLSSSPPVKQRFMAQAKAGVTKIPGVSSQKDAPGSKDAPSPNKGPVYHLNPFSDEPEIVPEKSPGGESPKHESSEKEPAGHEETDSYSFYQAADGQLIVLHPLSVKCLLHHYGSHKNLPHSVQGKVLELENIIQTEASRKRYRYLSHLPLTSMFQLCEIDLSETLPRSSLAPFREELNSRESRRQRRLKHERKLKSAEEKAEEKQVPPTPEDYIAIMNALHENEVPVAADFSESVVSSPAPVVNPPPADDRRLFSSVAKLGFAAGHDAPDLIHDAPNRVSSLKQAPEAGPSTSGLRSFAAVIQKEKEKVKEKTQTQEPSPRGSNKGKKSQKVLLSTTGGRRYGK